MILVAGLSGPGVRYEPEVGIVVNMIGCDLWFDKRTQKFRRM